MRTGLSGLISVGAAGVDGLGVDDWIGALADVPASAAVAIARTSPTAALVRAPPRLGRRLGSLPLPQARYWAPHPARACRAGSTTELERVQPGEIIFSGRTHSSNCAS